MTLKEALDKKTQHLQAILARLVELSATAEQTRNELRDGHAEFTRTKEIVEGLEAAIKDLEESNAD